MIPAIRSQADDLGDYYSAATGIDMSETETLTRQEFAQEADIHYLLNRYGVNTMTRAPQYGTETDYTVDLQQSLHAVQQAKTAITQVPPELKGKYNTWTKLLAAVETGEYQRDLDELAQTRQKKDREETETKGLADAKKALELRERAERELKREREDRTGTENGSPKSNT